jgi:hypothetical protein
MCSQWLKYAIRVCHQCRIIASTMSGVEDDDLGEPLREIFDGQSAAVARVH